MRPNSIEDLVSEILTMLSTNSSTKCWWIISTWTVKSNSICSTSSSCCTRVGYLQGIKFESELANAIRHSIDCISTGGGFSIT